MTATNSRDRAGAMIVPIGFECPRGHSHLVYVSEGDAPKFTGMLLARWPNAEGDDDDGWGDTEDPETD